ncbi:hypothetical protein JAAARDRAFT_578087 [Jaapia argillacea MUCL 33604]|uniref:F-box domain-containing protein n=1 Tax=Jaapia argillacea MUCL 33604 TaxID=933084 RepID=A0A067QF94_9AGAM|nr:hypothetical protein JAAARDRAFT_578087 [Jaapia argillacea MUCL 33604]
MNDLSAAQFALCISEICQYICQRATRVDLYRLAHTSRAFTEPALGRLWEKMDSPEPLLKLIPSLEMTSEWDEEAGVDRRNWTIPAKPIPKDDWVRFDEYARRIRVLRDTNHSEFNFDIFYDLFLQRSCPLLPLLHQLHLTSYRKPTGTRAVIQDLAPFLSPSLTSIAHFCKSEVRFVIVNPGAEREELDTFFRKLPALCPYLRTFASSYPHPMISLRPFTQLGQLRWLDIQCISGKTSIFNAQAIHILASLEALETLRVRGVYGYCFQGITRGGGFSTLRSLSIRQYDGLGLSRFLDFLPPASLTKLTLSDTATLTVGEVLPALQKLTPSLKVLFWTMGPFTAFQAALDDNRHLIEGLLNFRSLEILHIDHPSSVKRISFGASDVQRMSTAWSSLRSFGACSPLFTFNPPSLIALAHQLPTLGSLALHLTLEDGIPMAGTLPQRNSLDTLLIFSISPLTFDSEQLAHYIFDSFPQLICFNSSPFEELHGRVNELIKYRDQATLLESSHPQV